MKKVLNNCFFMLFIISCAKTAQKPRRNFIINIVKVHCDIFSNKVYSLDCFPLYKRNVSSANVYFVPNVDYTEMSVHAKCTIMIHNQKNFDIIDKKINVCEFLTFGGKGSLLQLYAKEFKAVAINLFKGCPLKKNTTYGLKEVAPDGAFFPPFTPQLNYSVDVKVYIGTEKIAQFDLFANVFRKHKM